MPKDLPEAGLQAAHTSASAGAAGAPLDAADEGQGVYSRGVTRPATSATSAWH
jgi:hypothetical protein